MRSQTRRHTVDRDALAIGLVISAVIHAIVLSGPRFTVTLDGRKAGDRPRRNIPAVGMRAMDLVDATNRDRGLEHADPTPEPSPLDPDIAASFISTIDSANRSAPAPSGARGGAVPPRPGYSDPRLWNGGLDPPETPADPLGAVRARIERSVEGFNDSIANVRAADRRVVDWTRAGTDGVRWGASPGAIHLGRISLRYCGGGFSPLDCGLGVSAGRIEEFEQRVRGFAEIERQRARVELDAILKDRAGAIRARADAKRDSVRGG